jgi:hypothetical protein
MIDATDLSTVGGWREALKRKLSADSLGAVDLFCVYIGDRLGLYRVLAGPPGP